MDAYNGLSASEKSEALAKSFMVKVYGWMVFALAVSGGIGFYLIKSGLIFKMLATPGIFYGCIILELVVVLAMSFLMNKMSVMVAGACLIAYSALNGVTFSVIGLAFDVRSIFSVFAITAGMFLAMSVYGAKTKASLNSAGRYLFMALIGILIASVVNIFLKSSGLEWIISLVAVVVFTGLTAFDTQRIIAISKYNDDSEHFGKIAIFGALQLYLDFINIFIYLLRLFGSSKD